MSNRYNFFREAVKNWKTSGTITPSSRFLANRMLKSIDFSKAQVIVEFGPGNGAITKKILEKLNPKAKLICFEINPNFNKQLKKIDNPQLEVLNISAENISEELEKLGYDKTCHIISSLPLTIIPDEVSSTILKNSYQSLCPNGTFIQFQYSLSYLKKLKAIFKKPISVEFEVLNLPPAFIYRCKKVA